MPIPFKPKVATSNHLTEGDVIYFTSSGWVRELAQAKVAATPQAAEDLLKEASCYPLETVGVVLVDVNISSGAPMPTHFREEFAQRPFKLFSWKAARSCIDMVNLTKPSSARVWKNFAPQVAET